MTRIAFLGLGAMGLRMAANLLDAGMTPTVWNRSPQAAWPLIERGGVAAPSPKAAAAEADIVISMVRDDAASRRVWMDADGALAGMTEGALAIECSTLSPPFIDELAAACAGRGVALLDAPVAGSRPQAEAKQLVFLVGGAASAIERARAALSAMGASIQHVGPTGHGMRVKLAVNAMLIAQVAALAEVAGFLKASGVDAQRSLDALNATAVASPALKGASASLLAQSYAPLFPVALAAKDCAYARAAAEAAGASAPLAASLHDLLTRAIEAGFGAEHLTALRKLYP